VGGISDKALTLLVRPRVLHGIPGRLRVHVPLLKAATRSSDAGIRVATRALAEFPGIESVEASPVTGNILIRYAAERLSQKEVVRMLQSLAALFIRNRERFARIPAGRLDEVCERFRGWVAEALVTKAILKPSLEIPDHVLE
jgi:copper chaperone CopZ